MSALGPGIPSVIPMGRKVPGKSYCAALLLKAELLAPKLGSPPSSVMPAYFPAAAHFFIWAMLARRILPPGSARLAPLR